MFFLIYKNMEFFVLFCDSVYFAIFYSLLSYELGDSLLHGMSIVIAFSIYNVYTW